MTYCQKTCKADLRKELLQIARQLPPENGEIAKKVLLTLHWQNAKTVFCYVAYKYEPQTLALLQNALETGKTLCVPLCEEKGIMHAVKISDLSQLKIGAYGILEPPKSAQIVKPVQIDLAIVPCLGADKNKNRIGKGGGYYDRFLPQSCCYKLLLCRKELLVKTIPSEKFDIICDEIIY